MKDTPDQPFFKLDPEMRRIAVTIGYMLIIAGFAVALKLLWPAIASIFRVMAPFIVATVVAYVFNPVVTFFQKRLKLSRVAGVAFLYLMILLAAGIFIAIVIPILSKQTRAAYQGTKHFVVNTALPFVEEKVLQGGPEPITHQSLSQEFALWADQAGIAEDSRTELQDKLAAWLAGQPKEIEPERVADVFDSWQRDAPDAPAYAALQALAADWVAQRQKQAEESGDLPTRIGNWMEARGISIEALLQKALGSEGVRTAATSAATEGAGLIGSIVSGAISFAAGVFGSVTFLIFAILVSFYLLIDFGKFRGIMEVLVPDKHEPRVFDVMKKLDIAVGGFIRGQVITALLVGLLAFIGLTILGLGQYALLIACIAVVGNLIPYLGPVMAATPAVLYMVFSDAHGTFQSKLLYVGLVLGLFGLIQVIEGFIFQPKIVGPNAQLHPVVVIIALVVGAQFGIMGMIIAVPAAAMLRVLFEEFFWNKRVSQWQLTTGKKDYDDEPKKPKKTRKAASD